MMHAGPSTRKRSSQKTYVTYLKKISQSPCQFCEFTEKSQQTIAHKKTHLIIKNIFGYDIWDDNDVVDHLMIVPKRHIVSISEMNKNEQTEYIQTISQYEKKGYSVYARAPQNISKSIVHQHTHLIKLGEKRKKIKLFLRKPHFLVYK